MSVWSKILKPAAARAIGGPLGALLRRVSGRPAEAAEEAAPADPTRSIAFTIGVVALAAKMAKADGQATPDEEAAFREVFHVSHEEYPKVRRFYELAQRDVAGFEAYAKQVAGMLREAPEMLEDLIDGLFHIAQADGHVHDQEIAFVAEVARVFGFSEPEFAAIRARHLGPDETDPYAVLGLKPGADFETARAAYRRLVKEHHPDSLIARGVPEEFVDLATEQLAALNAAWERIEAAQKGAQ